jgi:hypothetical protein
MGDLVAQPARIQSACDVHLRKAYADAAPRLAALRQYERQKKQARQRALLQLKQSTGTAYAKLCASNEEQRRARDAQQQEQPKAVASDAKMRATIVYGGNPYVQARMRQAAEHREREQALYLAKRRAAEVRIVNSLLREEDHSWRLAKNRAARRPRARYLPNAAPAISS